MEKRPRQISMSLSAARFCRFVRRPSSVRRRNTPYSSYRRGLSSSPMSRTRSLLHSCPPVGYFFERSSDTPNTRRRASLARGSQVELADVFPCSCATFPLVFIKSRRFRFPREIESYERFARRMHVTRAKFIYFAREWHAHAHAREKRPSFDNTRLLVTADTKKLLDGMDSVRCVRSYTSEREQRLTNDGQGE